MIGAAAAATVFFQANSLVFTLSPDNPFLGTLGLAIGLVAAGAVAFLMVPWLRERLPLGRLDPTTTRSRLDPYHAVLVQEVTAGTPTDALLEKLRPLRASLGVSDHEHAILEIASRPLAEAKPPAVRLTAGALFLGRYRVERTLREGGVGVTHLCRDAQLGRQVVVKTLKPGAGDLDALLHEARALGRVVHPRVVTLLEADRVGDEAFLVMEHVPGGSLADRLRSGPLSAAEWERLVDDLLGALHAVHAAGLVHRDVKPSNILLAEGGAKLADFGIAHIPGFETTAAAVPDEAVAGTIRYMIPKQARGRRVGPASDLYSAAVVLYEARTGRAYLAPEPGESGVELQLRAAAAGPFQAPLEGPPELRAWFERALHPDAAQRFASAEEMRRGADAFPHRAGAS
jgi:hypothetical protein